MEWLAARVNSKARARAAGRTLAASAESRASHDVAEAERLLRDGMDRLGMERATVSELPGSDPRKVAMAHAVHALTAVPHTWTEEKLGMRSAANVSQHLCRLARGEVKLTKEAKAWLSQTMRQC